MLIVVKGKIRTPSGPVEASELKAGDKAIDIRGAAAALEKAEQAEVTSTVTFKRRPSVVLGSDAVLVTAMGDRNAGDGKGAAVYLRLPSARLAADEIIFREETARGFALYGSTENQTLYVGDVCVRC